MTEEIPSTLYKYYEVKEFLPKIFSGEALKFSCPFDFNDPFESRTCYQIEDTEEGRRYVRGIVNKNIKNPSERIKEAQRVINRFKTPQPLDKDVVIDNIVRQVGVCCFSEVRDSILMWSHYAKEHRGICIGFDTSKSFFQLAWQVKYQKDFPIVIRPKDSNQDVLEKTLLTKAECWGYEKEWRVMMRTLTDIERATRKQNKNYSAEDLRILSIENGPGYYGFPREAITEIYLGERIHKQDREGVLQGVIAAGLDVKVYEAKRNSKQYSIEFELKKI